MTGEQRRHVHLTHWGAAEIESDGRQLTSVRPWREDPAPSRILENLAAAHRHPARIGQPHIRQGWLEHGPGAAARGSDVFVPTSWPTALDLLAGELRRVYGSYGPDGVFGGSYGWASAGRFHHAQSQLHRFLNCLGGYVRSVNTYSFGTSQVLLPHVVGDVSLVMAGATAWPVIAEHTDLLVAFGGLSPKNSAVASGGIGRHTMAPALASAVARGCRLVSVSPLRSDTDASLGAEWIAPVPGTDAALMLALCHVLDSEGLADRRFLDRYTVGYPRFAGYVRGDADGVPKTPEWAAALTGIAADRIRALARQMAAGRTLVTVSWSLQRAQHGEQPVWLGLVLAAMLGQIGLPGGGFGHGYGSSGDIGNPRRLSAPRLPQGANGIDSYIPVARIADMLLHPGAATTTTGSAAATRTSSSSTGAAGTRSTTTRTSPGCARRSPGRRPWWCMTRSGPPPRGTRTSSCPRRCRSSATISASAAATPPCSPCRSWPNHTRRRATTTSPSVPWRTGCRWGRSSPRAERVVSGCNTCTASGAPT